MPYLSLPPPHVQERLRVLRDYPTTLSLGDNAAIEKLLQTAKEKGKGAANDPFKVEIFTGSRGRKEEQEEGVEVDREWKLVDGSGKTSHDKLAKKKC